MEILWSPWRMAYIEQEQPEADACVFCVAAGAQPDADNLVVHRNEACFILLNRYPYNNGHLLVAPYRHVAELEDLTGAESANVMAVVRYGVRVLRRALRPEGVNVGINLGAAAGAGIPGHVHVHVVPRWQGDTSYMTVTAGTRVLPETLEQTLKRLSAEMAEAPFEE